MAEPEILWITQDEFLKPPVGQMAEAPPFLRAGEKAWARTGDFHVLGLVMVDPIDAEYNAIVFGRDPRGVFRCIDLVVNLGELDNAKRVLVEKMKSRWDPKIYTYAQDFGDQAELN